jgi:hypothetical protein
VETFAAGDCLIILIYILIDLELDQFLFVRDEESLFNILNSYGIFIIVFLLKRLSLFLSLFLNTRTYSIEPFRLKGVLFVIKKLINLFLAVNSAFLFK